MTRIVLAALLPAVACSGRTPPPAPDAAPPKPPAPIVQPLPLPSPRTGFAGRWTGAGSLTSKCGADPQSVDQDELDLTVTREGATLKVTRDTCTYLFDVRGRTATVRPGQRCAGVSMDAWTLTLASGDAELAVAMTTRLEAAPGIACTSRLRGALTRR